MEKTVCRTTTGDGQWSSVGETESGDPVESIDLFFHATLFTHHHYHTSTMVNIQRGKEQILAKHDDDGEWRAVVCHLNALY